MERRWKLLAGVVIADSLGAWIAGRHRVAGEPFGVGAGLDVGRPMVVALWGTGLSAPLWSFPAAVIGERVRPGSLRAAAAIWLVGALSEPVWWGRRPCPIAGRLAVATHVALSAALLVNPVPTTSSKSAFSS